MLNYLRFGVIADWVYFVTIYGLRDVILSGSGAFLILSFKSQSARFEYRMRSWDFQDFDILSLARHDNFLTIRFDVDIISADSWCF